MALSADELQAIITATTAAVLTALGRQQPEVDQPISDDERPKIEAFLKSAYPSGEGWRAATIKPTVVEIEGPKEFRDPTWPETQASLRVYQLRSIPVRALRNAMKAADAKAAEAKAEADRANDRKAAPTDDRARKVG